MNTTMNSTIEKKHNFIDYDVTIGVRIRLTSDQKQLIKDAYNNLYYAENGAEDVPGVGGVRVSTANHSNNLTHALGCDRMTLSSFLGSNERVQVGMLKRWQTVLGIELLSKKQLEDTWKAYLKQLLEE